MNLNDKKKGYTVDLKGIKRIFLSFKKKIESNGN